MRHDARRGEVICLSVYLSVYAGTWAVLLYLEAALLYLERESTENHACIHQHVVRSGTFAGVCVREKRRIWKQRRRTCVYAYVHQCQAQLDWKLGHAASDAARTHTHPHTHTQTQTRTRTHTHTHTHTQHTHRCGAIRTPALLWVTRAMTQTRRRPTRNWCQLPLRCVSKKP